MADFEGLAQELEKKGYVFVKFLGKLKSETIARLESATEFIPPRPNSHIFSLRGKTGCRPKEKDSVAMMKDWLANFWIDNSVVISDRDTLQTADKVEAFAKYLEKTDSEIIIIWVVTSWYHLPRTLYLLQKAIFKSSILSKKRIVIIWKAVYPPLTRQCLEYEYLYNMAAEPFKLATFDPEILRSWWRNREEKLREAK